MDSNNFYPGKSQPWTIYFSNGLENVNTVTGLLSGDLHIFAYPHIAFSPLGFDWDSTEKQAKNETQYFYVHSLKWIDQLIDHAQKGVDEDHLAAKNLALEVAHEWWLSDQQHHDSWLKNEYIWGGHGVALRTTTLVALSELDEEAEWLYQALIEHEQFLKDHFDGYWNHGLVEALALIAAAGRLSHPELLELGKTRTLECLNTMVDDQGCINEQAPEYARYIESLTRQTEKVFRQNSLAGSNALGEKKQLLREFMAHATNPHGEFVPLGDSAKRRIGFMLGEPSEFLASNGASGRSIPRIKIYDQGFVFGRSGFGNLRHPSQESFYTLRFGPQRIIHGHNDHTSITTWAEGRNIIVDPGHIGYTPGPERRYVQTHDAHNVTVVRGLRHDWSAHTSLIEQQINDHTQSFTVRDEPYSAIQRTRTTLFTDCGPTLIADDLKSDNDTPFYSIQRWNIAPEFTLTGSEAESVNLASQVDGLQVRLIRFYIDNHGEIDTTNVELAHGDRERMLGLVARNESLTPAWNIGFGKQAKHFKLITAIVTAQPNEQVGWSYRKHSTNTNIFRLHIGNKSWAYNHDHSTTTITPRDIPAPFAYGGGGIKHQNN